MDKRIYIHFSCKTLNCFIWAVMLLLQKSYKIGYNFAHTL